MWVRNYSGPTDAAPTGMCENSVVLYNPTTTFKDLLDLLRARQRAAARFNPPP